MDFLGELGYLSAHGCRLLLQILLNQLVVLLALLQLLILFLQVVALLDDLLNVSLRASLHLLVLLGLSALLLEPTLEELNLVVDLPLLAQDEVELGLLQVKFPLGLLNFVPDLLRVLEVHLLDLSLSRLNVVAELLAHGLLPQQGRPHVDQLLQQVAVLRRQLHLARALRRGRWRLGGGLTLASRSSARGVRDEHLLPDFVDFSVYQGHHGVVDLVRAPFVLRDAKLVV